ncbi:hypothetical protein Z946_1653 [Sulfitobacter noctilucicola]|nr:hypothetical protein Z946_1653 [Sulfitobacter noctilucicola]
MILYAGNAATGRGTTVDPPDGKAREQAALIDYIAFLSCGANGAAQARSVCSGSARLGSHWKAIDPQGALFLVCRRVSAPAPTCGRYHGTASPRARAPMGAASACRHHNVVYRPLPRPEAAHHRRHKPYHR